ncbi:MAG TPA: transglycosylase SLT domain-containing protein [Gaiellales bacterium]|nr:transglycosylase SLT domain-containing protein [Gaiellales bacterium]
MALMATVLTLMAPGCQTDRCDLRVSRRACWRGDVGACIHHAAARWRVPEGLLRRRAWCESRMNPGAYNASSGSSGLFQFIPSTWRTTPYARRSIWSAHYNALAAAWMVRVGRGGEWVCR